MEPPVVPDIRADYEAGINRDRDIPASFYHFAFAANSPAALAEKRDDLHAKGIKVTDIVDHGLNTYGLHRGS
jgi:hypothetical protein